MLRALILSVCLLLPVSAQAKYFAQLTMLLSGNSWPSGLVQGMYSDCFTTPLQAVTALPSGGLGWSSVLVDSYGNWIAVHNMSGQQFRGIYLACDSQLDSESTADAATISALQATIASLQTTVAVNANSVATLQAAVATSASAVASQASSISSMQTGLQSLLSAAAVSFDPVEAFKAFSFFFVGVVTFWGFSKGVGAVLSVIRKGGLF